MEDARLSFSETRRNQRHNWVAFTLGRDTINGERKGSLRVKRQRRLKEERQSRDHLRAKIFV